MHQIGPPARMAPLRHLAVLAVLVVAACAAPQPVTRYRNPATGAVVTACGPYPGLAIAVDSIEKMCRKKYAEQGWVPVPPDAEAKP